MTETITFATVDDAKHLVEIYAPYVTNTTITFEYEIPSVEEFASRIKKISSTYPYLVYRVDGVPVGYAYASQFQSRAAFMWDVETSIYVKEEYQNRKIAKKLYDALFTLLKAQGFYNAYAQIAYPNPKSIRFHEKYDFMEIARYRNTGFKLNTWCDLICMEKHLINVNSDIAPKPFLNIHELDASLVANILQGTR